jgi:DNA gyrase subunit A
VIALIKAAPSPAEAKKRLVERAWQSGTVEAMLARAGADASRPEDLPPGFGLTDAGYRLTETQAQAILDLRLQKLTGLEQDKIIKEFEEILDRIAELLEILSNPDRLMAVIKDELIEIREQFGDERRSEIIHTRQDLTLEDLITEEDVVVTLSHLGYAKAQPLDVYRAQRRGGKGKAATTTKDEDFVEKLFVANTHDTILCFSSRGKCYWLKVYELPQAGRNARGRPMVNLLPLEEGERINAILPIREYEEGRYVFMATASGTVKKTPLLDFSRPRASGIIAVDLREDDQLIGVELTDGEQTVMLFSSAGKALRFDESMVRPMGRTACGVRGIKLGDGQRVISLIVGSEGDVLTATQNGFGKRTAIEQFPVKGRAGMGVISIKTSDRNGEQIGAVRVFDGDEIMLITDGGTLVRTPVNDVSRMSRDTQGVKLITLSKGEKLIGIARIEALADDNEDASGDGG